MSWFSGLAEKAEAFLDQMDQTAATTLHDAGITPQKKALSPHQDKLYSDTQDKSLPYEPTTSTMDSGTSQGSTVAQILVGSASGAQLLMKSKSTSPTNTSSRVVPGGGGVSHEKPLSPGSVVGSRHSQKENDDILFEFLNTPSKTKPKTVSQPKVHVASGRTNMRAVTPLNIRLSQQPGLPRPHSSPVMLQPSLSKNKLDGSEMAGVKSVTSEEGVHVKSVISEEKETVGGSQWKIGETESESVDADTDLKESEKSSTIEDTDTHSQMTVIQESTDLPASELTLTQLSETQETIAKDEAVPSEEQQLATSNEDVTPLRTEGAQTQAALDALNRKVSTLELENKLLKREVGSLNDELGSVLSRMKEASDNIAHYDSEIHALREQASQTDYMIRQLRSHEEDLQATVDSKESQIQVLRTRFSEAERVLEDFKHQISSSQKEKERYAMFECTHTYTHILFP